MLRLKLFTHKPSVLFCESNTGGQRCHGDVGNFHLGRYQILQLKFEILKWLRKKKWLRLGDQSRERRWKNLTSLTAPPTVARVEQHPA